MKPNPLGRVLPVILLLCMASLFTALPAGAQAVPPDPVADSGTQTLEDILRRQDAQEKPSLSDILQRAGTARPVEGEVQAAPEGPQNTLGVKSFSDYWRRLQQGSGGAASSATADGLAMQTEGDDWRLIRTQYIVKYSGWILGGTIGLLALFYIIRGRIRIRAGRSGKTIPRFTLSHRIAHWFMACVFIILGLTGLIILLGRPMLLPVIGAQATSIMGSAALQGHNLFGPIFIFALLWMFFRFMRGNFLQMVDFQWMLKLGGLIGGHASSREFNFGEKSWFWMVILIGSLMAATGIVLLLPALSADVRLYQLSTVLHGIGAVVLIAVAFGHAYIGSIGMEGSLDSMLRGEVDENWAREHHDLWYEEVTGKPAHAPEETPDKAAEPGGASA